MKIRFLITLFLTIMLGSFSAPGKESLIRLLEEYSKLNEEYLKAYENKDFNKQKKLGKQIRLIHDEQIIPSLPVIEKTFCTTKDENLLNSYLYMLSVIGHSASEAPRVTFGKMYLCQPGMIMETIEKNKNKKLLLTDLEFGFENAIYEIDTSKLDITYLRIKIQEKSR